jgi:CCR4-NOT transcriptional regulation complex NOT5 subunit
MQYVSEKMSSKKIIPEWRVDDTGVNNNKKNNYCIIYIKFDDSALELKTINTNYRGKGIENKNRPITLNVKQLKKGIDKLKKLHKEDIKNKSILFVVFPLSENNIEKFEAIYLPKLRIEKQDIMSRQFNTISGISNRIYCVIVRE